MTENPMPTDFKANELAPSEQMIWSGVPSQWGNFSTYAACALVSLTLIGLLWSIPWALWAYLSTKSSRYELTNQRLVVHAGVFTRTQEQLELYRVRDTKFIQPLVLRFFGVGNVMVLSSDASTPYVMLCAIEDAPQVMQRVRNACEAMRSAKRVHLTEVN